MSEATMLNPAIPKDAQDTKDRTPAKVVYTVLTAFNLLSYLYLLAIGAGIDDVPLVFWVARLISVPMAFQLGKLWKDRGFCLLAVYLLWVFFRAFIPEPGSVFSQEVANDFLSGLWLFSACYGLGRILNDKQLKKLLLVVISIWTIGIVICCGLGLYAAWTDQWFRGIRKGHINAWKGTIGIFYLSTTTGAFLSISALLAVISAICVRNRAGKILFFFSAAICWLTLALTDSRTGYISVSTGFGVIAFVLYYECVNKKRECIQGRTLKRLVPGIAVSIVVFAVAVAMIMQATPVFNYFKTRGLLTTAYAEELATGNEMAHSGFTGEDILSGRTEAWGEILNYIKDNPIALLVGKSKYRTFDGVLSDFVHSHSIYLQILIESGLPGLLTALAFLGLSVRKGIKAATSSGNSLWKLLPLALIISLLAGDLVECFTWLRSSQCPMIAVLFIAAGIINSQYNMPKKQLHQSDKEVKSL